MKRKARKTSDPRSELASVSSLLEDAAIRELIDQYARPTVVDAVRQVLQDFRARLKSGEEPPSPDMLVRTVREHLAAMDCQRLRRVVNGTGIVLHTGLGRAVLAPDVAIRVAVTMFGCCNMQIDMETGLRGKRCYTTEQLLQKLTGAEAAMVVNNNAAATFLILAALCPGKEVIVSRGQLIEIGGSYRLPDCIRQSGAILVEVGTTNKTHLRDYEQAMTENTGALLHVHPSNYRIIGFTESVGIGDLAALRKNRPVLLIDDLGCGALLDLAQFGLPHEPTVQESIQAGADLVCFSGDKLIGGPQSGIIVGKKDLIDRIKKHPLSRMLRVCKLTDAVLEHTLRLFLTPETLPDMHPTLNMMLARPDMLRRKAMAVRRRVQKGAPSLFVDVVEGWSQVGGGTLPGVALQSWTLAIRSSRCSADELSARLRRNDPPIIARIENDAVLIDLRTLMPGEERYVEEGLLKAEEP